MKKCLTHGAAFSGDFLHTKCRNTALPYLKSNVYRQFIPKEKLKWDVEFPEYQPTNYTSDNLKGKDYTDDEDPSKYKFNCSDDNGINRKSFICDYTFDNNLRPLNPMGRTGICGRGLLGRWGPNHAADPIVSRFYNGQLQFVGIQRNDNGEWAIPGGMIDKGEMAEKAAIREFKEEALDEKNYCELDDFLSKNAVTIFEGYVDDPRNTDNAWIESTVINFHNNENLLSNIQLKAGDDAGKVDWIYVKSDMPPLYASHEEFIKLFAKLHNN